MEECLKFTIINNMNELECSVTIDLLVFISKLLIKMSKYKTVYWDFDIIEPGDGSQLETEVV